MRSAAKLKPRGPGLIPDKRQKAAEDLARAIAPASAKN